MVMVLDWIQVLKVHNLTVAYVKMSLFLELIWTDMRIQIIGKKDILILSRSPTKGLDDTTLIAETQY